MNAGNQNVEDALVALRRITRAIDLHSRRLQSLCRLTGPQLLVLREIARLGQVRIGELAARASLSGATMTGIVDRLERQNLVSRIRGQHDRRQVLVTVTGRAGVVLEQASPLLQDRFVREMTGLSEKDQCRIVKTLNQVASMMGSEDLDVAPFLASGRLDAEHSPATQVGRKATPKPQVRTEAI